MSKYATISVPREVKKILEEAKGDLEWGEFLLSLYKEVKRLRGERAFRVLTKYLSSSDLDAITCSSREFRERFSLR